MKKNFLLLSFLLISFLNSSAKHVDLKTAKQVGSSFLSQKGDFPSNSLTDNLQLAFTAGEHSSGSMAIRVDVVYYYVFNVDSTGFVIVSGDDQVIPVLGYSDEIGFDPNNIPYNTKKWLEEYKQQIRYVIDNNIKATQAISAEWNSYQTNTLTGGNNATAASVSPLVKTKWNQSPYYNAKCPGGSVTGCVATAMAQVMKYYNYPKTGSGFHSYNHSKYGTLSASFGSVNYDWSSMPNTLSSSNSAVATLMLHCGISVDMDYSPQSSGAYVISDRSPVTNCAEYALETYFGYRTSLDGIERVDYTQSKWISTLKAELDASRPILYAGFGSGGGHAFVCDGYDNSDYFHFNWGWGGAYNGYFSVNALNPSGTGTGGGSGGYNSGHQAIIGIQPPSSGTSEFEIELYDYLTISDNVIGYGNGFEVKTNFANFGDADFSGDYCAAAFDEDGNFIEYIEILTNVELEAGYTYNGGVWFETTGSFGLLPGTYDIHTFLRPTGGNWVQINDGSYTNTVKLTVVNENDIELNKAMVVSGGTELIIGEKVSVNVNIVNSGNSTFYGDYVIGIYNLDGTHAQTIAEISESSGLSPGYTYKSPYLTFSNNSVDVEPGTYLLAMQHKRSGAGWQLTGTADFQNPIKVTVKTPSLPKDQYEDNNTANTAYTFTTSYSGNTAAISTSGSTLHDGEDQDFYNFDLASGFDYTITAELYDSHNEKGTTTYTCDALFSHSSNGTDWSDSYDDEMSGDIRVKGGGKFYFQVAPYFAGESGTYLLQVTIKRTASVSVKDEILVGEKIRVYPNPTKDQVQVDVSEFNGQINSISVLNIQGTKTIQITNVQTLSGIITVPLTNLSSGTYFIKLESSEGILTRKIIVLE